MAAVVLGSLCERREGSKSKRMGRAVLSEGWPEGLRGGGDREVATTYKVAGIVQRAPKWHIL